MTTTNFNALTTEQKTAWSRDVMKQARDSSFLWQFVGKSDNSMVQRITELKKDEKGARAVISCVNDLVTDGVAGDNQLEGNEEEVKAWDAVIQMDQLRNANQSKGKMSEQKNIIDFRKISKNVLGYWMGDRIDQLAFLTLAGINYTQMNDGRTRVAAGAGTALAALDFAADVTAPTSNRHFNWNAVDGLAAGNTAAANSELTGGGRSKFGYNALIEIRALARTQRIRAIRGEKGMSLYHVFVHPNVMRDLKLDPEFKNNVRNAMPRSGKNPLFAGAESFMIDGMMIHDYNHVYNTLGAAGGSKWGGAGADDGSTVIVCGAQALGLADIGDASWEEDAFDYKNRPGIAVGKIFGMLKPVFNSVYTSQDEDFGVIRVDVAIS